MPKNDNIVTDAKTLPLTNQVYSHKSTNERKIEHVVTTTATRKPSNIQTRVVSNGMVVSRSVNVKSTDTTSARVGNTLLKRNESNADSFRHADDQKMKKTTNPPVVTRSMNFHSSRAQTIDVVDGPPHDNPKPRYCGTKVKNYNAVGDCKDEAANNNHDFKSNCNIAAPFRFASQSTTKISQRDATAVSQHARPPSRGDSAALGVTRKSLEQPTNIAAKMTPTNFPPLRAPQSIVDVRHPFVTEARTKHSESEISSVKTKTDLNSLQIGPKELAYTGHSFHGYGRSTIAGIPSIQSLANVGTNISPYVRSDSYGQPTVANVVYPETAQFPQSPPFNAPQVGQYRTYDHSSYATTPVNVNQVLTQFSTENSIPYPQFENSPQFVQTNHYATSELANGQYQFRAAGVGQIQESPVYMQSLQSPIAVTDQYTASNYARAVRTELMPRLHQPPRFSK